ncbi:PhnD/SsuA/transferrin family substrate-binding protein [Duganella sp. CY15W]|uniref:phosphate/phosphite/phosphonate ABC transporter substrate-binding protein n=1 Tax=Duganella sp. CY15W TaxID=2692172 RepID=UPI00136D00E0|nr:PhnD/SsuA/transferrin family substrate-binding protein [Duganella sp. CY15W]MYM27594.1 PhnD/SsuA/transferrin family substrate-binding protein [Duganella sp. CY15W]
MNWKAALPMYNLSPRIQREYEALLARLLVDGGVRDRVELLAAPDLHAFWRRSDTLVSQTCGYPYMTMLRGEVTLLATPSFAFFGCEGSDYSSLIVVRAGSKVQTLADLRGGIAAANDVHSNSGMNVLRHAVAPLARDGRFFGEVKWSGSHVASLRMVRDGEADVAAIDCVTYGYLLDAAPDSVAGVRILQSSAPSPGLPLVAGRDVPPDLIGRLRAALLAPSPALRAHMTALRINGFEYRAEEDYQRILHIEEAAERAAYPLLM